MDGTASKKPVSFDYGNLSCDNSPLVEPWEVYLRIGADFQVRVADRVLYSEPLFTVVEFAIQSRIWSINVVQTQQDFIFTSMEAEEPGLVWIKQSGTEWQVGSLFQEDGPSSPLQLLEVQAALDDFYSRLRADVATAFRTDIASLLTWKGIPTS